MMDLKDIIKWFIPCFHILLVRKIKMNSYLIWISVFLLFNLCPNYGANVNSLQVKGTAYAVDTKNVVNFKYIDSERNQSEIYSDNMKEEGKSLDPSVGRTFGRPFKKMVQALIPLVFQVGAASTWAVVAALIGLKTLVVAVLILKILLMAGAAKLGALFSQKSHHGAWEEPHQKEIHLHIHSGHPGVAEEHYPSPQWSRDGSPVAADTTKTVNYVANPYSVVPHTIHTPYGNYIKVEPSNTITK